MADRFHGQPSAAVVIALAGALGCSSQPPAESPPRAAAPPVAAVETSAPEPPPRAPLFTFQSTVTSEAIPSPVKGVALSPDGSLLALGGDPYPAVIEIASGKVVASLDECGEVPRFSVRGDALYLTPCRADAKRIRWDLRDGTKRRELASEPLAHDERELWLGHEYLATKQGIRIKREVGKVKGTLADGKALPWEFRSLGQLTLDLEGRWIADTHMGIIVRDLDTGKERGRDERSCEGGVAWVPKRDLVAVVCGSGGYELYGTDGKRLNKFNGPQSFKNTIRVVVSPDGKRLLEHTPDLLVVFDVDSGQVLYKDVMDCELPDAHQCAAASLTLDRVAYISSYLVEVHDVQSGKSVFKKTRPAQ